MTARFLVVLVCAAQLAAIAGPVSAQSQNPPPAPAAPRAPAATPPAPPQPPQPPAPRKRGQLINIKTEFTITDRIGSGAPLKRTVTLIVADGDAGSIRSQPDAFGVPGGLQFNVDTRPEIVAGNKIRLSFSLQYDGMVPVQNEANSPPPRGTIMKTTLRDTLSLILEDGKSMMVAQSADPTSDRQVTVDVKATIMK